mgnify:CR=1 FL=1
MTTALKLRRGTTSQHSTFTGAAGEVTVDTDKKTVVVHDGTTAGGYPLVRNGGSDNVGIGTSSPTQKLEVAGSAVITGGVAGQGAYIFRDGATGGGVYSAQTGNVQVLAPGSTGVIQFNTNASEKMRLDASGNVGIGTNSPSTYGKLALSDNAASPVTIGINNNSASTSAGVRIRFTYNDTPVGYILNQFDGGDFNTIYQANRYHIWRGASDVERMRIDSSGNVLVGSSSATHNNTGRGCVEVNGLTQAIYGLQINGSSKGYLYHGGTDLTLGNEVAGGINLATNATTRLTIDSSGNIQTYCQGTSPGMKPAYDCRAWVNFNGTGTPAIRASGNVTSITKNSTGIYYASFSTSLPDTNYSCSGFASSGNVSNSVYQGFAYVRDASSVWIWTGWQGTNSDREWIGIQVFR